MKRRSFAVWCLRGIALSICASVTTRVDAGPPKTRLAIVVAKDSPVNDLSSYDLKRLYKGDPVNAAGKRLVPLNLAPLSHERVGFDQAVLGMDPDSVARYWIDRKIRGQSGPPKAIDPPELMPRVVTKLDGAIGYVRVSDLRPEVKFIRIDGKGPADPGYLVEY